VRYADLEQVAELELCMVPVVTLMRK